MRAIKERVQSPVWAGTLCGRLHGSTTSGFLLKLKRKRRESKQLSLAKPFQGSDLFTLSCRLGQSSGRKDLGECNSITSCGNARPTSQVAGCTAKSASTLFTMLRGSGTGCL